MKRKYNLLSKLDLINKDDILLKIACVKNEKDIIKKVRKKRKYIEKKYKKYNKSANIIQKNYRIYLLKNILFDRKHRKKGNIKEYTNEKTLLGEKIENIEELYFFSIKEKDKKYAFDIRELKKVIDIKMINPYTNNEIEKKIKESLNRIINKLKLQNTYVNILNEIPNKSKISSRIGEVHNLFTSLHVYCDLDEIYRYKMINFQHIIEDILSNELLKTKYIEEKYEKIVNYNKYYDIDDDEEYILDSINLLLDIYEHLLKIDDKENKTRALAISQIILNYSIELDNESESD